ncbi:MAG: serine/threonine protein kinase [Deltaproteobacteria bacterium]|nr:serine/threonine protein kinase [Deltaproteobacteria bacterium]
MGQRYEILRKLGAGGMGTVYLAKLKGEAGFERLVALKKLNPEVLGNEDVRTLFVREIQLGARLVHPAIVQVLDAGISTGEPYLASEFVDGSDLEAIIDALKKQGAKLPPEAVAYVGSQVCQALAFMVGVTDEQGQRVIQAHRDISPSNVLVARTGAVKLADFGVARLTTSQTSAAVVRGKWQYFPPEISTSDPDVRSDLFALGITLFQLASLRHPFEAATAQGYYERAATFHPPRPDEIPEALWSIVNRALAKDPATRFQSPAEMGEALDQFVASTGKPMSAPQLARLVGPLLPPPVPTTTDPTLEAPFARTVMSGSRFEMDPEWRAVGPAMGADGQMVGKAPPPASSAPRAPAPIPRHAPPPASAISGIAEDLHAGSAHAAPRLHEVESLELHDKPLVEKPPPDEPGPLLAPLAAPAAKRGGALGAVVVLLVLAAAGGGFYAWKMLPRPNLPGTTASAPLVVIDSTPDGASVYSGQEKLGETPLSFPNDYPAGQTVSLQLRKKGYASADIAFDGDKPQHINAKLKKK